MKYEEMLERLDAADTEIVNVYYKLKQSGDEKAAAMLLFNASIGVQQAIEIIEKKVN